jgi:carbon-monoxide dehydrogenase small subunit
MSEIREIRLTVNGKSYQGRCEPRKLLVDFVREDLGLTGTHIGCEHGICGACTILFNGEAARSCLMFAVQAEGAELMTVEGLAKGDEYHPLQQAFHEHHALQCGYCTPGMLIAALDFLATNPSPTEDEIREGISSVLCRCTGYVNIVKAVAAAAEVMRAASAQPSSPRPLPTPGAPVPAGGRPGAPPQAGEGRVGATRAEGPA